jgi:hypothetical protein
MELGGQNICPTTFAPHVWHLRGKLGVNLPHYLIYPTIQTGPKFRCVFKEFLEKHDVSRSASQYLVVMFRTLDAEYLRIV